MVGVSAIKIDKIILQFNPPPGYLLVLEWPVRLDGLGLVRQTRGFLEWLSLTVLC